MQKLRYKLVFENFIENVKFQMHVHKKNKNLSVTVLPQDQVYPRTVVALARTSARNPELNPNLLLECLLV